MTTLPDRLLAEADYTHSLIAEAVGDRRNILAAREALLREAAAALSGREAVAVPESEWRWHGLAAHFICAADCLFHMATEVGDYMISTVGDLRLHTNGEGRGERQEIGCGRTYETFVFKTKGTRCTCGCGMPEIDLSELDTEAANDPATARDNHMALCAKYAAALSGGEAVGWRITWNDGTTEVSPDPCCPDDGSCVALHLATTPQPGDGWRPIMTAPHGVMILLADMGAMEARHWSFVGWRHAANAPQCATTAEKQNRPATHWMPLPAAPSAKGVV